MSTIDSIARLDAAVRALGDVDVSGWDDATLRGHLDELSDALCRVDAELSRLADAVRARGFRVAEPAKPAEPAVHAVPAVATAA